MYLVETAAVRALRAAALHERVLLVEAGPGWGKTTAVRTAFADAKYVEVPPGDRRGALHVAVLQTFGVSAVDAGRIVSRIDVEPEAVADAVANAVPARARIIIDDVHRINAEGRALIGLLVDSGNVHLVLVGRSLSALPVGAWIATGRAGMPLGPDTLALRVDDVRDLLGDRISGDNLPATIVSSFGGWPIAASLAVSLLRRGYSSKDVLTQLRDGVATVAASVLQDVPQTERALLVEMALMASYGVRPSDGHLALLRRLGFPESASGPHEVLVSALLEQIASGERAVIAAKMHVDREQAAPYFALLASEAPAALRERCWDLLPVLYDRYDGETLERFALQRTADRLALMAARCFLLALRSQFSEASAIAERIIDAVGKRSDGVALRLARVLLIGGRGTSALAALKELHPSDPADSMLRHCLLGSIRDRRASFVTAMEIATNSKRLDLIAIASNYAAYRAVHAGELDDAEGLAARGEDAARASGSVLQQARALKIRYGVAMLRADLDVAAVYAGRLTTLQPYVSDPSERATDLVSALEVEVFAGRAARATAFDEAIRRIGHGWLDMETYVVCRAIMDAWEGRLLEGADRLSAFGSLMDRPQTSRLPVALGAFFAAASGATERAAELLALIDASPAPTDPFARSHYEMAASFAALAETLLAKKSAATRRLKMPPKTGAGALFIEAARLFAATADADAYMDVMRKAGYDGIVRAIEACDLGGQRSRLSPAERQVLDYLASGLGATRIAQLTGRSINTIRNQRRSLVGKLGAATTLEAVAIAKRLGLLKP